MILGEDAKWLQVPQDLTNALQSTESVLLMAHQKPDGDAIGSMIALGKGLKKLGKTVHYAVDPHIEDKLLCFEELNFFNCAFYDWYDVAIFVDCSTYDYAVQPESQWVAEKILVIDHHRSNIGYGDINFIEETSATAELIYRILCTLDIEIDDEMADALYTAISTDTGQFQYSNVTWQTHAILSRLYQLKPSYTELSKRMHSIKSADQFKMYGEACQSLELSEDGRIAWIYLPYEVIQACGGSVNITDDIASLAVNVKDVALGITVKETEKRVYRVSLRSSTPWPVDVSVFAARYGGGGHYRAAGLTWKDALEALKTEVANFYAECLR